jgi:CMP-N,N'-diacetyllegionaminic acid synthase
MKIACIIPARGGSKGIPNKNIIDFCGKPLIAHSILQCKNSKYIQEVFVSSDSEEILEIAKNFGAKKINRPENISLDNSPSEECLTHAIMEIQKEKKYDYIVFLQATSPIREPKDIDNTIEKLISDNLDSVFSSCELEDFLIWKKNKKNLESLNYDYKNRKRRQDSEKQYVENGSIYSFKVDGFLKNNNRLFGKIGNSLMENWKMFEIDTIEDLELCSYIFKKKILTNVSRLRY